MADRYIIGLFGIYDYLVYFIAIWYILGLFGMFCGQMVYFRIIWYVLWSNGIF
jgi:hypothetical protein